MRNKVIVLAVLVIVVLVAVVVASGQGVMLSDCPDRLTEDIGGGSYTFWDLNNTKFVTGGDGVERYKCIYLQGETIDPPLE